MRFQSLSILLALVAAAVGCAGAPTRLACFGAETACAARELHPWERDAAEQGIHDARSLASLPAEGYVIRRGEVVLYTFPARDAGPPPEGAVARYAVDAGGRASTEVLR